MTDKISYRCRNFLYDTGRNHTCRFWQDKGPNEECEWCARNPKEEEE